MSLVAEACLDVRNKINNTLERRFLRGAIWIMTQLAIHCPAPRLQRLLNTVTTSILCLGQTLPSVTHMGITHAVSITVLGVAAAATAAVGFLSPGGTVTRGRLHPASSGFVASSAHHQQRWSCSRSFDRSRLRMVSRSLFFGGHFGFGMRASILFSGCMAWRLEAFKAAICKVQQCVCGFSTDRTNYHDHGPNACGY